MKVKSTKFNPILIPIYNSRNQSSRYIRNSESGKMIGTYSVVKKKVKRTNRPAMQEVTILAKLL